MNGLTIRELEAKLPPHETPCEYLGVKTMETLKNTHSKAVVTAKENPVGIAVNGQTDKATWGLDGKACLTELVAEQTIESNCLHLTKEVSETPNGPRSILVKARVTKLVHEKAKEYPLSGEVQVELGGWTTHFNFNPEGTRPTVTMKKGETVVTRQL